MLDPGTERRNLIVLLIATYLAAASFTLVMPFLPVLLQELGVGADAAAWTGLAFSAAFLTQAVFSPIWGAVADRVGRKPMMIRAGLALGLVYLLMARVRSPLHVIGLRLLSGALAGFIPSALILVATTVPAARVGRSMGLLQVGPAAGTITGPLLGGTLVHLLGIRPTLQAAAGMVLVATALVAAWVREPPRPREPVRLHLREDVRAALGNPVLRRLLLLAMLLQMANGSVEPLITLYVAGFPGVRAAPFLAGLLVSLTGLAVVLWAPRWGRMGERRGYALLLRRCLPLSSAGHLLQWWAPNLWLFGLARFTAGTFQAAALPSLNALVANCVETGFRGRAFGLTHSAQMLGNLLGPLVGGLWAERLGVRHAFVLSAAMYLAAAAAARGLHREEAPAPARPEDDGRVVLRGARSPIGVRGE